MTTPIAYTTSGQSTQSASVEQEFLTAYDQYADAIFRHCYFRVFDRERGKDLMQEVFMRAWEYLCKGEKVLNMRAFLYRIANNLIVDESRKRKETSLEKLQEEGFDPGKDETPRMHSRIEHSRVIKKLGGLDDHYRDIIIMRYINDLSPSEIAEVTGESANTVSVRIYRGLKQLRSLLAEG
ncbi:MAG TPA: RNA polymerase sigma factor [Candidatus Peribacteraceae bacterium]|nr:RNA polymerase sigma factor [Candidatus Peribacteraceae bacterium]